VNEKVQAEMVRRGFHLWAPHEENVPQNIAYLHPADEILYGGAAGGGKTDLLLGIALTLHKHSIIYRREYKQFKGMFQRAEELIGPTQAKFNRSNNQIRGLPGNRIIDFGAVQYETDVWNFQGQPRDFIGFDELTHFTQYQYSVLLGWLRSTVPNQRIRVVAASNPPPSAEGFWVVRYWAPWLDHRHPNPAQPGEMRYFIQQGEKTVEVEGPEPVLIDGDEFYPKSRTFIPARIADNVYLMQNHAYMAVLQGLPERLRKQLLDGDWTVGQEDHEWQVIPTAWILAAQERWHRLKDNYRQVIHNAGVDVARGGRDKTVIALRYGRWVDDLIKKEGPETPDGKKCAAEVMKVIQPKTFVSIDVIGVGSSAYDFLRENHKFVRGVNVSNTSSMRDHTGKFGMMNQRSEMWWNMRQLLDPNITDESEMPALPDDPELLADLTAPTYEITSSGNIKVELKKKIIERLGRSPDCGDAVCMAFMRGKMMTMEDYMRKLNDGE